MRNTSTRVYSVAALLFVGACCILPTSASNEDTNRQQAKKKIMPEISVNSLKKEFNRLRDKVRVVAILSPTCDACQWGRGVVGEVFANEDSANLAGLVVWLPMKSKDSAAAAREESEALSDARITVRAWDKDREIGKVFAKPLKLTYTAWDVYLVYAPGAEWTGNEPPKPTYWMHQLQGQSEENMMCVNPAALSAQVKQLLGTGSRQGTDTNSNRMKIRVLYFDDCPSYHRALANVREVIAEQSVSADVEIVAVKSVERANAEQFLGSPTVQINGEDIEGPRSAGREPGLTCRVYADDGKLIGWPSKEMIRTALSRVNGTDR